MPSLPRPRSERGGHFPYAPQVGGVGLQRQQRHVGRAGVRVGLELEHRGRALGRYTVRDTVSRRHAVFRRESPEVRIVDLGSLNGTYVNDKPVQSALLANGGEIQIGQVPPGVSYQTHDGLTPRGLSPDRKYRPVALLDDLGRMPNLPGAAGVHECATVTIYSRLW